MVKDVLDPQYHADADHQPECPYILSRYTAQQNFKAGIIEEDCIEFLGVAS